MNPTSSNQSDEPTKSNQSSPVEEPSCNMFLFKASKTTYRLVIKQLKHAFPFGPSEVTGDELILLSENRPKHGTLHKQVQFLAKLRCVRTPSLGELEACFPGVGASDRWSTIVELYHPLALPRPFNLSEVPNFDKEHYRTLQGFGRIAEPDQYALLAFLGATNEQIVLAYLDDPGPDGKLS